jgi:hypothetical protein
METRILGIVGNVLFIQGFYAGDHMHTLIVPEHELEDFIYHGVPVYENRHHIDCQEHGMTYDEYMEYVNDPFKNRAFN